MTKKVGVLFEDNFVGHRAYSATEGDNAGHNWVVTDSSAAGSPTIAGVLTGRGVAVDLAADAEVENVSLSFGDALSFDIDDLIEVTFDVKLNQANIDAASQLAIGLVSDRDDSIDDIAEAALFRVVGADDTTAIVIETDDGTTNNDDVDTGATLSSGYTQLKMSFATGKHDVRFFVDGQPVAMDTVFDLSKYSGGFQPFVQIQKTATAATDGFTLKNVRVTGRQ